MGALAITTVFAYGFVQLQKPRLKANRRIESTYLIEGESFEEVIRLRVRSSAAKRATLIETTSDGLASPTGGALDVYLGAKEIVQSLTWTATTWGKKRVGPLHMILRDQFDLIQTEIGVPGHETIFVRPAAQSLGKYKPRANNPEISLGAHSVSKPGDGFEFFSLRGYQPGDSIRRINWKASARSSTTVVNQPSRDSFSKVLMILDLRAKETIGIGDDAPIVRNGRAAASLVAHHDRMKDHLTLVAVTSEARNLSGRTNPRMDELLDALARVEPGGDMPLDEAIRAHVASVKPRSPVYFMTSGTLDPSLLPALDLVHAIGARPLVISPAAPEGKNVEDEMKRILGGSRTLVLSEVRALGCPVAEWSSKSGLEESLVAT